MCPLACARGVEGFYDDSSGAQYWPSSQSRGLGKSGSRLPSPQSSSCTTITSPWKGKSSRKLPEILHPFPNEMARDQSALGLFCGGYGNFGTICWSDTYTMNMGRGAYDTAGVPKPKVYHSLGTAHSLPCYH